MSPRVAVSALFALNGAVLAGWMSHLPEAKDALHLSVGQLGATLLFSSVGALSAMSLSGTLIHRYGSRRVSVWGGVLVLCIIPFLLIAPSQPWLAFGLFLMGAANGTLDVAMNAHSMAVQARLKRPILSSVHGWWCVGGFLGGAGTSLSNALQADPRLHLVVASAALLVLLVALVPGLLPNDADQGGEGARFVVPKGVILTLGLLNLLALFAEGALWDWSAIYFRETLGASKAVAAMGFGVGVGAMAIGRMTGDYFVARFGSPRTLLYSGALTSGGLLLATAAPNPAAAFVGFAATGLGLANAVPIFFAAAADAPGVSSGAGIAAVAQMGYAAFLGGPPLVGNLAEATSLRFGLALVGVLAALIAVFGPKAIKRAAAR